MAVMNAETPLTIVGVRLSGDCGLGDNAITLQQGTITVLLGPNGSGKTSLMEKIAGLRPPEGLTISFGTHPLWRQARKPNLNETALRAYAYASQSSEDQFMSRTVREELLSAMRPFRLDADELEKRSIGSLEAVGMDQTWLMRNPLQLSGGERRKIALACLFAAPAEWLLLDEPTAGLDAQSHDRLGRKLKERAAEGQGILLISHDSDWALPIADLVLVMRNDGAIACFTKEELLADPKRLTESGLAVPDWLAFAHHMHRSGIEAADVWDPVALANGFKAIQPAHDSKRTALEQTAAAAEAGLPLTGTARAAASKQASPPSPLTSFDPRSVWAAYILLSAGIMMQQSWSGIAIGAALTAFAVIAGRIPLQRWRKPIQSITVFTLVTAVFAGIGFSSGLSWQWSPFFGTIRSLTKPWLAMLLGLGLPLIITPLRLRRSLEQLLAFRGRLSGASQNLILIVTLLLRFVPVLITEWERFAKLAASRGKQSRLTLRRAPGRIREITLPFMISLFRMAEDAAAALESRGVGRRPYPVVHKTLFFRSRDYVLVLLSIMVFILLWLWDRR